MGNQNFIVINGKKYDAVTGKMLAGDSGSAKETKKVVSVKPTQNVGVVDGFRRAKPKKNIQRSPAHHASKSPAKSQTLARKAVKKPEVITKTKQPEKPGILKSKLGVSPKRASHAKNTQKHPHVQKFEYSQAKSSIVKKSMPLSVKQAPAAIKNDSSSTSNGKNSHSSTTDKRVSQASHTLIEAALAQANSHNEQSPKQKKRRKLSARLGISSKALSLSAGVLAVVILAGFFAMQNVPNISMRVAAARAGFDARLPGYKPAGFSFNGPINYSPGQVTVTFSANSDDRQYDFVQKNSNWNSDALLANFIVEEDKTYQTYQDRGRTLYIYDGSNATWIDDGIWYQVEGNSGMTTDQLIRIASSI